MTKTLASKKPRVKLNVNREFILIDNNLVEIQSTSSEKAVSSNILATIVSNLAYYGFILSKEAFDSLSKLDDAAVKEWWKRLEPALKEYTGDSKKMDKFVVYKNFPQEVLDMSQTQYWFAQICMYWGVPNEYFTQEVEDREPMLEKMGLKVLHLCKNGSVQNVLNTLLKSPAKWTNVQYDGVYLLVTQDNLDVDIAKIPFKDNMIKLVSVIFEDGINITLKSATDILRLATGLSGGDVTFVTNTKFKKFSRKERKQLLSMLENSSNLAEDMMRYKGKWKRLMYALHPGDYADKFPGVCEAYNALYNGKIITFNSEVESGIKNGSEIVLDLLKSRPGEFMRRLNKIVSVFGNKGADAFISVVGKLTVSQLLKIEKYLEGANVRWYTTIAPKGNWTKLQIIDSRAKMPLRIKNKLLSAVRNEVSSRVSATIGSVNLKDSVNLVKLQTNGSELASYGRGTEFSIPDNIKFIRTASYWENKSYGNTWFDNGWNFFGENWEVKGTCSWDRNAFGNKGAIFSGDPTNSKEMQGKACQMIDLYLDELAEVGVRYAVWNILCYSGVKFSQATDVFAALQWGEEKQKGKLFEPSRCQLAFPIEGDSLTKYIAYIDIKERKLVYMDANLRGNVRSAGANEKVLSETMPAFVEYLNSIPSVYDLFKGVPQSENGVVVTYDDNDVELKDEQLAYVFKPLNEKNSFKQLNLSELLS